MLDVHILTLPDTRRDWQEQCIASVELAASLSDVSVHIHVLPGILGHVGKARAAGYAKGSAPYVTYVDCDDYIHPDSFSTVSPYLGEGYSAVFPGEFVLYGDRCVERLHRHHLACYRREIVESFPMHQYVVDGDLQLIRKASTSGAVDVPRALYYYRQHNSSGKKLARSISHG